MQISVVTAVYNRADTIAQAMRSVQSQTYPDVEHVIQDGGSRDATLERVAELANAATRMLSEPDDGIYDAINRGIRRAKGEVIGLMHSDDFFANANASSEISTAITFAPILDAIITADSPTPPQP